MDRRLEQIIKLKMDEAEAKAFKLCILWEQLVQLEYPKIKAVKLPAKGDPRKSTLFKYCWKLLRETKGLIEDRDYQFYIRSQLQIFKNLPDPHVARIDPNILVGEKAWKRWLYWKNLYDRQVKISETKTDSTKEYIENSNYTSKVIVDLKKTKEFLNKRMEGQPTVEVVKQAINNKTMLRWVTFAKVSPYYILLSPFVAAALGGKDPKTALGIDLGIYFKNISPNMKSSFNEIFDYEIG